jgi:hypothetical protein
LIERYGKLMPCPTKAHWSAHGLSPTSTHADSHARRGSASRHLTPACEVTPRRVCPRIARARRLPVRKVRKMRPGDCPFLRIVSGIADVLVDDA